MSRSFQFSLFTLFAMSLISTSIYANYNDSISSTLSLESKMETEIIMDSLQTIIGELVENRTPGPIFLEKKYNELFTHAIGLSKVVHELEGQKNENASFFRQQINLVKENLGKYIVALETEKKAAKPEFLKLSKRAFFISNLESGIAADLLKLNP